MKDDLVNKYFNLRNQILKRKYMLLDDFQKEAVFSNNRNLLVVAGPGAGKTRVIVNRIDYLVKYGMLNSFEYYLKNLSYEHIALMEDYIKGKHVNENIIENIIGYNKVNPDNIIVITFTRAAALNMKERYQNISNSKRTPFFGTFHSLFYKILIRKYGKIEIISEKDSFNIVKNVLKTYLDEISEEKIREVICNISLFKTSEIDMEEFKSSIDKNIFIDCFNSYEKYKYENNLLDFDDLQIKVKEMFISNPQILNSYRKLFKYILVDEFQDCDALQIELLKMLNNDNSIFAVGDEDQCIYGFRGSKPECMVNFSKYFKGGSKVFLSVNYRSTKTIVEMSKILIKNNKMRNDKKLFADKKEGENVKASFFANEDKQAEQIIDIIVKSKMDKLENYKDNAVLYRTNVESRSMIDICIRRKIPFKLLDKQYNFFNHFICQDIISYLKLSIDCTNSDAFSKIINKPFRYISRLYVEKVKKHRIKNNCFETLKSYEDFPIFQIKKINDLRKSIHSLNRMSLKSAVYFVIHNIGYYDYLKEYSAKFKTDISELDDILEEFCKASSEFNDISSFLKHVEEVEKQIEENKNSKNADCVILSTIHGVKGMEFKNVFIINCNEDTMPHINSIPENIEEERRLFYVAMTRAINVLWMGVPQSVRGKAKQISRFVEECSIKPVSPASRYCIGQELVHASFGLGKVVQIKENDINIEFKNGVMRRFDINVLEQHGLIRKAI